jgi:hypothetical protein
MDPNMTASNFREFLKQIGKYLSKQEKLKQMEDHALIKKKLDFLHEYKEFIQENEGQSLQKFPTIVDHLDNGYNSNLYFKLAAKRLKSVRNLEDKKSYFANVGQIRMHKESSSGVISDTLKSLETVSISDTEL